MLQQMLALSGDCDCSWAKSGCRGQPDDRTSCWRTCCLQVVPALPRGESLYNNDSRAFSSANLYLHPQHVDHHHHHNQSHHHNQQQQQQQQQQQRRQQQQQQQGHAALERAAAWNYSNATFNLHNSSYSNATFNLHALSYSNANFSFHTSSLRQQDRHEEEHKHKHKHKHEHSNEHSDEHSDEHKHGKPSVAWRESKESAQDSPSLLAADRLYNELPRWRITVTLLACAALGFLMQRCTDTVLTCDEAAVLDADDGRGPEISLTMLKLATVGLMILQVHALPRPESFALMLPEFIDIKFRCDDGKKGSKLAKGTVLHNLAAILHSISDQGDVEDHACRVALRLRTVRWVLLGSWALFIALPLGPKRRQVSSTLACLAYLVGAAAFLGLTIGVYFESPSRHNYPAIVFVFAASCALPALTGGSRHIIQNAGRWLGHFTNLCIVAPIYFSAGLSKIRYHGLQDALLSDGYLRYALANDAKPDSQVAHCFLSFLTKANCNGKKFHLWWLAAAVIKINEHTLIFSWGILVFELAMPAAVVVLPASLTWHVAARRLLVASALGFHLFTYLAAGANFQHNIGLCVLLLVAERHESLRSRDPSARLPHPHGPYAVPSTSGDSGSDGEATQSCQRLIESGAQKLWDSAGAAFSRSADVARQILTVMTLIGWALTNVDADSGLKLIGLQKHGSHHEHYRYGWDIGWARLFFWPWQTTHSHAGDRLFPFSIHPMYTRSAENNLNPAAPGASFAVLMTVVLAALLVRAPFAKRWVYGRRFAGHFAGSQAGADVSAATAL